MNGRQAGQDRDEFHRQMQERASDGGAEPAQQRARDDGPVGPGLYIALNKNPLKNPGYLMNDSWPTRSDIEEIAERVQMSSDAANSDSTWSVARHSPKRQSVLRMSSGKVQVSDISVPDPYVLPKLLMSRTGVSGTRVKGNRKAITKFSDSSRRNLRARFLSTDFSAMIGRGSVIGMVTLTYPGDWEIVASSRQHVQAHFTALMRKFERDFGYHLAFMWKLEFQRRGAPHYHILMALPDQKSKSGQTFHRWLAESWAGIVNHPNFDQYANHFLAGIGIDVYGNGVNTLDLRKAASYFCAHSLYKGKKEYQHEVPALWQQPGKSVGRFWAFSHDLPKVTVEVKISDEEQVQLARILRRCHHANGRLAYVRAHRGSLESGNSLKVALQLAAYIRKSPLNMANRVSFGVTDHQYRSARMIAYDRILKTLIASRIDRDRKEVRFQIRSFYQEFGFPMSEHPLWTYSRFRFSAILPYLTIVGAAEPVEPDSFSLEDYSPALQHFALDREHPPESIPVY